MRRVLMILLVPAVLLTAGFSRAEPYLAVRSGSSCGTCHTNQTGAGQRNVFGNLYAQQQLTARPLDEDVWTGELLSRFTVGADARVAARQLERDDRDDNLDFGVDRVTLYGGASLNDHVTLYVDQQIAPGRSTNREAWIRIQWGATYLKAGRMFLPFGWRLEDDEAFTRQATGVNLLQGDDGLEFGYVKDSIDLQIAVANGSGGANEVDDGKLFSGRFAWVAGNWQLGISGYHNDTDFVDRSMYGVFGGVNTGPVTWLAEYDWIDDKAEVVDLSDEESAVGLLEANWLIAQGHNLKATFEVHRFDGPLEDQLRGSLVYEFFPWAFTQLRVGVRVRDSDDPQPSLNSEEGFIQLHAYF